MAFIDAVSLALIAPPKDVQALPYLLLTILISYATFMWGLSQLWPPLSFRCGKFWPEGDTLRTIGVASAVGAWATCVTTLGLAALLKAAVPDASPLPYCLLLLEALELALLIPLSYLTVRKVFAIFTYDRCCS